MDRRLYKGGIVSLNTDRNYGYIESIDHPESIWFSMKSLITELKVGDAVVYETRLDRKGEKVADRIRKLFYSSNRVPVLFGIGTSLQSDIREKLYSLIPVLSLETTRDNLVVEKKLNGNTGRQLCVEVGKKDKIIYAKPWKKNKYWKFVLEREPVQSDILSLRFKKDNGFYIIISAHYGPETPAFPWDKNGDFRESKKFWDHHALVLDGSLKIEPGSIHGYLPEELRAFLTGDSGNKE
jgi:hypothetical protein